MRKMLTLECEVCGTEYTQQARVFKIALWKNRCKKHRSKQYKCVDCGDAVYRQSVRCRPCSDINRRILNWDNKCVDCGCDIGNKSTRCQKCHNINQDKGKSRARTKFNASRKWAKVRTEAFKRDDYTCQICNTRGSVVLNGHHIKSYKNHVEDRLNVDNILTLCEGCHKKLHWNKEFREKYSKLIIK